MLPSDTAENRHATPLRTAMFSLSRLVTALALYPWFMGRLGELADALELPLRHQTRGQAISCLAALAALLVVTVGIERRPLSAAGFRRRGALRDFGLGILAGGATLGAAIAFLALAGWYHLSAEPFADGIVTEQARVWLVLLLASAAEEIVFRGLVFRIVEDALGSASALILSAAYFSWQHGSNPSVSYAGLLGILLAGVFFGAAYAATRSLWLVIGIHWAWNLFEGPIFGAPVSGYHFQSILHPTIDGPELWTGGKFGPEASLPALTLLILLTTVTIIVAKRKGEFRPLQRTQAAQPNTDNDSRLAMPNPPSSPPFVP